MTSKAGERVVKKKNNKINPVIYLLICGCLLFAIYNSVSVFVLGLFGDTTTGFLTSYDSRLEDRKAEPNRSRTVSKGYNFTVNGKEYKGYVIYWSDEAWPRLKEGEVRKERISYLSFLPYVNKPEHLVDFDELGPIGLLYHGFQIPGCIFLFLLVNGWFPKRGKQSRKTNRAEKKRTVSDNTMFCYNCGARLTGDGDFCINCGTRVAP